MIKLLKLLEAIHVQHPSQQKPEMSPVSGYVVTGREFNPETGTSTTHLQPEPKLSKFATDLNRMIKVMKYFEALPENTEMEKLIKSEAKSIVSSLRNAEGKLRNLHERLKANKAIKGGK